MTPIQKYHLIDIILGVLLIIIICSGCILSVAFISIKSVGMIIVLPLTAVESVKLIMSFIEMINDTNNISKK